MNKQTPADVAKFRLVAKKEARRAADQAVTAAMVDGHGTKPDPIPPDRRETVKCECGSEAWEPKHVSEIFYDKEDNTRMEAPTGNRYQCIKCGLFLALGVETVDGKAVVKVNFKDLIGHGPGERFVGRVAVVVDKFFGPERDAEATEIMRQILMALGYGGERVKAEPEIPVQAPLLADSVGGTD